MLQTIKNILAKIAHNLLLLLVPLVLICAGVAYIIVKNPSTAEKLAPVAKPVDISQTDVDLTIPVEQQKTPQQAAWIPDWGIVDGLASLNADTTRFSQVSPVFYEINADGTLKDKTGAHLGEIQDYCTQNNSRLFPTIASFDWQTLSSILNNDTYLQRHINRIVKAAVDNNYYGIDLDYESTKLTDKDKYLDFIKRLSDAMHASGKKLAITVLPQWGDTIIYNGLSETRKVQDWTILGGYADEIRIMGYEYTSASSHYPGPIGPLYWAETVIRYAVTKIPREKIWYGVHIYGYEWSMPKPKSTQYVFLADKNALALTYDTLIKSSTASGAKSSYDPQAGEQVAKYDCYKNRLCLSYFMSKQGVADRMDLAKRYGLAGLVYWRLGREGDLL